MQEARAKNKEKRTKRKEQREKNKEKRTNYESMEWMGEELTPST
jgi:hypothetical protein